MRQRIFDHIWRRQLGNPKAFWAPVPLPSIALDDPAFVRPIPPNSWGGAAVGAVGGGLIGMIGSVHRCLQQRNGAVSVLDPGPGGGGTAADTCESAQLCQATITKGSPHDRATDGKDQKQKNPAGKKAKDAPGKR